MEKKIESGVKNIPYSQQLVYSTLSNFSNISKVQDRVPAETIQNLTFDSDSISFSAQPVGRVTLRVMEREEPKCIKMGCTAPAPLTLWIQIVSTGAESCKIKLTSVFDVNVFIAKMVEKPIRDGMEQIATMLQNIPYDSI